MMRTIIKIDEELCNGCEACVEGCHEGALQMIDGKARLISELFCDGLGACIGECPVGAITLEQREAVPYDEIATLEKMIPKGEKTIVAHLKHLKVHGETEYLKQAVGYLKLKGVPINFSEIHQMSTAHSPGGGCPGSKSMVFDTPKSAGSSFNKANFQVITESVSELRQWPIQLHLLNPQASFFKNADVLLAADCVPFSFPDFHRRFLAGKTLAIACPKLDSNKDVYVEKLKMMIAEAKINTLQVLIMEVPCCGGLLGLAAKAIQESGRKIPMKTTVIGLRGDIISDEWV